MQRLLMIGLTTLVTILTASQGRAQEPDGTAPGPDVTLIFSHQGNTENLTLFSYQPGWAPGQTTDGSWSADYVGASFEATLVFSPPNHQGGVASYEVAVFRLNDGAIFEATVTADPLIWLTGEFGMTCTNKDIPPALARISSP